MHCELMSLAGITATNTPVMPDNCRLSLQDCKCCLFLGRLWVVTAQTRQSRPRLRFIIIIIIKVLTLTRDDSGRWQLRLAIPSPVWDLVLLRPSAGPRRGWPGDWIQAGGRPLPHTIIYIMVRFRPELVGYSFQLPHDLRHIHQNYPSGNKAHIWRLYIFSSIKCFSLLFKWK